MTTENKLNEAKVTDDEINGPYGKGSGQGFTTTALHHGHKLDSDNRARAVPIYNSTSFVFKDAAHGADLFSLSKLGPIYTRIMNPTCHVLEYRIAALEGAACPAHGDFDNATTLPSAMVTSSGQAAQLQAILTIMGAGDNFIAASELYGGTFSQFRHTLKAIGITVKFFDVSKPEEIDALVDKNTKAIYCETLSNPSFQVPDFEVISAKAKQYKVPFIVDNTFGMCGYTCRPLKFGADIVVESCTKWIGGHGTTIGGVIVDGSSFNWCVEKDAEDCVEGESKSKFPQLADPQPSYHNGHFSKHPVFGVEATNTLFILLARVKTLRDCGACLAPSNAFQLIQGLETLPLRARAHSENANRLAKWLEDHDSVAWVLHASLESHPSHSKALKYFRPGCFGGVLSFGIKARDGKAAGEAFINNVKIASHLANVGDAKTLVIHPASTTHQQLSSEEQLASGVRPEMIRVSVGYEDYSDLQADFENAFKKIEGL